MTTASGEPKPGWSEAISLGDLLLREAGASGESTALVTPEAHYTYADLAGRARRVARNLIGAGVGHGDHVGMLQPNGVEALATIFGVALAGAVLVPINTRFRAAELRHILASGDLAAILTTDPNRSHLDFVELLGQALPELGSAREPLAIGIEEAPRLRTIVALGGESAGPCLGGAEFEALGERVSEAELDGRRARVALRDPALLLYTSGTTSAPRGCVITHEGLVRNWTTVGRRLGMGPEDRVWNPLPLFHIGGIGITLLTLAHGACMLSDTHFEASAAVEMIAGERPTVLYPVFPPIMMAVINHPRFPDVDVSGVRAMLTVGDPAMVRQVQDAIPGAVHVSTYGLTETTGVTTYHDVEDPLQLRMTTTGSPQPGVELRIVDPESGAQLDTGEAGEIRVRGWNLFAGYYGDKERTEAAFDAEGWLLTSDQGKLDERGHLHFEGRLDEMIKVGGENVSPAELEAFLAGHPAVHLAQVVGVPDPHLGEVAAAFLELKPGAAVSDEEVLGFCNGQIARFKIPRHVRLVEEWPMSATKVQKGTLRDRLVAELAGAGEGLAP
jgi:acyl-CoA synthetase (AMP-forming)/AMP-acid ligase II